MLNCKVVDIYVCNNAAGDDLTIAEAVSINKQEGSTNNFSISATAPAPAVIKTARATIVPSSKIASLGTAQISYIIMKVFLFFSQNKDCGFSLDTPN